MTYAFFMLENISGWEWFIILSVIYLFFGAKAFPRLFRGLRQQWTAFRQSLDEVRKELK